MIARPHRRPVSLICMPWHQLGSPSMQLGTLTAALQEAGIGCRAHSFHLAFQDFVESATATGFSIDDFGEVCSTWCNLGVGDWVFAVPEVGGTDARRDREFERLMRSSGVPSELIARLQALREHVPEFLARCADEVLEESPTLVGFTNVYSQTWSSAALASVLRARAPELVLLMGGASTEGPMGAATLLAFPQFDAVVQGEAEHQLPALARRVLDGHGLDRSEARGRDRSAPLSMDSLPTPVFDEYFERLAGSALASSVLPQVPFETARGCWWGMVAHCTFCGLNGLDMSFRSKSAERVLAELEALGRRHGVLDFTSVDNIMDMAYFEQLLPQLAGRPHDLSLFFETKSNLKEHQVIGLRDAGVRAIQPGIESLSTPILKLMRKGVNAFQNVRLLKWCALHGVSVLWNLLYGFPGEPEAEYERMAALVPALAHLAAPDLSELAIYRFSPYHAAPADYGLELLAPLPHYGLLYDLPPDGLAELAQSFAYRHLDGRNPADYVGGLRTAVERWKRDAALNRGALSYRRGPDLVAVTDTRTTITPTPIRYTLEGPEAELFLACDAGATRRQLDRALDAGPHAKPCSQSIDDLLGELLECRLLVELDGRYLSLALPVR